MRLSAIIAKCKSEGVTECELHPDGSIARLVFGPAKTAVTPKPVLTPEELKLERERNRPDSIDLAVRTLGDLRAVPRG